MPELMKIGQAINLVRQMGPGWAAYRAGYSLKRHSGWYERTFPITDWSSFRLSEIAPGFSAERLCLILAEDSSRRFFIQPGKRAQYRELLTCMLSSAAISEVVKEVEAARSGTYRFFSGDSLQLTWPPEWHRHPQTLIEWPKVHWSHLQDFGESDVKWLWETARFGLAYKIVRAYWLTGNSDYAETFWQLLESWRAENPPNCGVHWMCGQECSFRVLALCFALFGLLDAPATTPERVAMLLETLAAHGERIEGNLSYAISQKNNHSINEALALWTLGTLFPMLQAASRWQDKGRKLLELEARRQIYDDGSYVQHSLNYHRLIVQSYTWAIRLGELSGAPFSSELCERYSKAARFLIQLTDETSGGAPNYGSNDGALLFQLDACDFSDYRPTLALALWLAERRRAFPPGHWDEPLLWITGEDPFAAAPAKLEREDLAAESGGYYTLRGEETWGFTRCCAYRDRPAQADMLHVDLWWRGANILADPGTYSYNSPPPWNNGLSGTGSHNAVQVDRLDQMERGPRFTWFYWNRGKVIRRSVEQSGRVKLFEGEHDGYLRTLGVTHRRALLLVDGRLWVIIDDIKGVGVHRLSSYWLFPEARVEEHLDHELHLRHRVGPFTTSFYAFASELSGAAPQLETIQGAVGETRGWFSPRYLQKESALSIVATDRCSLPARRVTIVALGEDVRVETVNETGLTVSLEDERFSAEWAAFPYGPQQSLVLSTDIAS
ncbi:MAG: alginate lyase family protein [Pyrinomonadaceae bacterium]